MRHINANATQGKEYDLDKIAESRRDNASLPLKLQNWYWHPEALAEDDYKDHANPDPPNPEIGQVWVSIKCRSLDEMKQLIYQQATGGEE